MKTKPAEPAHGIGPRLVPAALTFVLTILSVVPLQLPGYAALTPNILLMSVYHWTIYRPEHLTYLAVFLLGLLFDLLTTAPGSAVGMTPLLMLLVRSAVLGQRRSFVGRSFPFVWSGFTLTTVLVNLALWGGGGLVGGRMLEPRSFAFQAVLTVGFFPVMTWLFTRVQRVTAAD